MIKTCGLFLLFLLLIGRSVLADEQEERVIANLREVAARLGWFQDVFIGLRVKGEDVKVFGIADIPFSELNTALEKSYIQWVLGHRFPLEKILDQHLKNYQRLGFQILPIEGIGEKAYRAFSFSYVAQNAKELELSYSQDVVEILWGRSLLTLKDERLNLAADTWALFEEVFERARQDRFIQPFPDSFPEGLDLKKESQRLPRRIRLSRLFPTDKGLPMGPENWSVSQIEAEDKRGEILSAGKRYRLLKGGSESLPEVKIFSYAYVSSVQTQEAFKRYLKKIEPDYSIQYDEENKSAFLVSGKGIQKDRYIFNQDIFVLDLGIVWEGVPREERKKLLKSFSLLVQKKIKNIFSRD